MFPKQSSGTFFVDKLYFYVISVPRVNFKVKQMSKYNFSLEEISSAIKQYGNKLRASKALGVSKSVFYDMCDKYNLDKFGDVIEDELTPDELLEYTQNLVRKNQKTQDLNRIERKTWRENTRYTNAIEELSLAILDKVEKLEKSKIEPIVKSPDGDFGIIHLSDLHFGEGVDLDNNKYNWEIAGKRLRKYITESMRIFDAYNIKDVLVVMTGDLVNSDRRLDEVLSNVDNRASIVVGAVQILQQLLTELATKYHISVVSTWGNESRRLQEIGYSKELASDNYDHTIYQLLKGYFLGQPIDFLGEGLEVLINYKGTNIYATHGHTYSGDLEKAINQVKSKYSGEGFTIDYFLSGHIHNSRIGYDYSRAGSLTGNNAYNFNALHINGRATLNTTVFMKNKDRLGFVVDLQNTDGIIGYDIKELLQEYHTKSKEKTQTNTTILKVVV